METNGWVFDVEYSMNIQNSQFHEQCGGDKWYGWSHPGVGSVTMVLVGSGEVTLSYGNCFNQGIVSVLLNDKLISSANANVKTVLASFTFSNGDVLKLTEEPTAIIKLNSIEVKCISK